MQILAVEVLLMPAQAQQGSLVRSSQTIEITQVWGGCL